jgi:hypothetical protein
MRTVKGVMLVIAATVLSPQLHGGAIVAGAADTPSSGPRHVSQLAPASPPGGASPHTGGAPVIANESIVTGEILDRSLIDSSVLGMQPARMLARITLRIACVQDVPAKANFLAGKSGEVVEVYSRDVTSTELIGQTVNGRIVFRGDERGGSYWIVGPAESGSRCSDSQQ